MPPPGWSSLDTAIADMSNPFRRPPHGSLHQCFHHMLLVYSQGTVKVLSCRRRNPSSALIAPTRLVVSPVCDQGGGGGGDSYIACYSRLTSTPAGMSCFPISIPHMPALAALTFVASRRFTSLHCPRVFDTSTMRRQHLKLVSQPQVFHHCGFQNGGPAEAEQGTHSPIEH